LWRGLDPVTHSPYYKYICLQAQNQITFLPSSHIFKSYSSHIFKSHIQLIYSSRIFNSYIQVIYSSHIFKSYIQVTYSSHTFKSYIQVIYSSHIFPHFIIKPSCKRKFFLNSSNKFTIYYYISNVDISSGPLQYYYIYIVLCKRRDDGLISRSLMSVLSCFMFSVRLFYV
jgi:hypothetical protein